MTGMHGRRLGLGLLVLAALAAGCGGSSAGKGQVLAQVGNHKITVADLNQALDNLPGQYRTLLATSKGKHQILDNLVKKTLLVVEAERRGLTSDAEVRAKVKEQQARAHSSLQSQLTMLQHRLKNVDHDVYENVLLSELNARLKQDKQQQAAISDEDVQAYYNEYVRKLKAMNPAAKPPALDNVSAQIRSVLVEERLLKDLEKKDRVSVQEELFQKVYGEKGEDVTIQENAGTAR